MALGPPMAVRVPGSDVVRPGPLRTTSPTLGGATHAMQTHLRYHAVWSVQPPHRRRSKAAMPPSRSRSDCSSPYSHVGQRSHRPVQCLTKPLCNARRPFLQKRCRVHGVRGQATGTDTRCGSNSTRRPPPACAAELSRTLCVASAARQPYCSRCGHPKY